MTSAVQHAPVFSENNAAIITKEIFGLEVAAEKLHSERDQNFKVTTDKGDKYVLKIANRKESFEVLDFQNRAMKHVLKKTAVSETSTFFCPQVLKSVQGESIATVKGQGSAKHFVRLLTYLPGKPLALAKPHDSYLMFSLGNFFGELDCAFESFDHPAAHRDFHWDLKNGSKVIADLKKHITDAEKRRLVENFLKHFVSKIEPELKNFRTGVIHNDGNDYNVLVSSESARQNRVSGVIDFGDMVYTHIINELAIVCAYAMMDKGEPLKTAEKIVSGYNCSYPLEDRELEVLFDLIQMRLCMSVCLSAYQSELEPDNEYLKISEKPAWELLEKLEKKSDAFISLLYADLRSNKTPLFSRELRSSEDILKIRNRNFGKNLSIAYKEPLKILRGIGQYLYNHEGKKYLDCVNNVCHVGHCHPAVVKAGRTQMGVLNTNTRYLHDNIIQYSEKLLSKLPEHLSKCFFVCTGSEANELALRLARSYTGQQDIICLKGAYHGNTQGLVDISPYKHDGPGGKGTPPHVHKVTMPDPYRGIHKGKDENTAELYAGYVKKAAEAIKEKGTGPGIFICESMMGCGGQIEFPKQYMKKAFSYVHQTGGICIADEVQTGFGRAGTHFWAFETQDALPDIVTLGKPMGNGHPVAAVITTPEIAECFANGMEYFNTYGGNPVSCAIGMAVLDVIEKQDLQKNSLEVGNYLLARLNELKTKHQLIGDVRGRGLFIGIELVKDRQTLEPATEQASYIINRMKEQGILISTDGPFENVLKIKPPVVFSKENADQIVNQLANLNLGISS